MRYYVVPTSARDNYEKALPEEFRGRGLLMIGAGDTDASGEFTLFGIAAFDMVDDAVWELTYICTIPAVRRTGVAREMVTYAMEVIRAMGGERLCAGFLLDEDTYALDALLNKAGFITESSGRVESIELKSIKEGLSKLKSRASKEEIKPLSSVSANQWQLVCDTLLDEEQTETFMDIDQKEAYNKALSHISFGTDGSVTGVLLISDWGEELYIDYIWSASRLGITAVSLVQKAVEAADGNYSEDTLLTYHLISQEAHDFLLGITKSTGSYKGSAVVKSYELL